MQVDNPHIYKVVEGFRLMSSGANEFGNLPEGSMTGGYILVTVERHGDSGLKYRSLATYLSTLLFLDKKWNTPNLIEMGYSCRKTI